MEEKRAIEVTSDGIQFQPMTLLGLAHPRLHRGRISMGMGSVALDAPLGLTTKPETMQKPAQCGRAGMALG